MHDPRLYAALAEWAQASAEHAAFEHEVGMPIDVPPIGGADAILMAVDLLWLAVADMGEISSDDLIDALVAVEKVDGAMAEAIAARGGAND